MGKRDKGKNEKSSETEGNTTHNPFGQLASLRDELPEGPGGDGPADAATPNEGPSSPFASLFAGKLVVRRERKGRGGKTVTRVEGIDADPAQREALAKKMRKSLGCGGHVEGTDIVLQGAQVERAAAWLEAQGARRVTRAG